MIWFKSSVILIRIKKNNFKSIQLEEGRWTNLRISTFDWGTKYAQSCKMGRIVILFSIFQIYFLL